MSKGRILIATYVFPPEEGGVGMAAWEMARSLGSLDWDIQVMTRPPELPHVSSRLSSCPVTTVPDSLMKDSLQLKNYLDSLLQDLQPDFIIYHSWADWCRQELAACARERGIPFILRSHGTATDFLSYFNLRYPPFFGIRKWLRSFYLVRRNILHMHRQSPLNRLVFLDPCGTPFKSFDYYYASGQNLPCLSCIPNTFPALNLKRPWFREKHGLNDKLVFTYAASASRRKQQRLFIRHAKRTGIRDILFLFLVPQRNAYAEQMEQDIGEDPRFRILYSLPRPEIEAAIVESDAVFLYSYQEQQPLCMLEAMSCGVPWIAPDVGAVSILKGGIMLKRRSVSQLKKALQAMTDVKVRQQLGREGFQLWQARYTPETVYRQWEELLLSAARPEKKPSFPLLQP